MNSDQPTRRELVAATATIGLGALLSSPASAQTPPGDILFSKYLPESVISNSTVNIPT